MSLVNDYREILKQELNLRSGRNPRYSLRAFSRDIGLAPTRVSAIFKGREGISFETAEKICDRLGFDKEHSEYFCVLVESQHARSSAMRSLARERQSFGATSIDCLKMRLEPSATR